MSRAARKHPPLKIKRAVVEKLLMYGLSRHEFGALLFGRNGVIIEVRRIRNIESQKYDYFEWDRGQRSRELLRARKKGLSLMAECHSHPRKIHSRGPSNLDSEYFDVSLPHLIVYAETASLSGWSLNMSMSEELKISKV